MLGEKPELEIIVTPLLELSKYAKPVILMIIKIYFDMSTTSWQLE